MFFEKLVREKNDKVEFESIPKTNEECKSVTYGCIRFIDSYRFLSSSLDFLSKTLVDNSQKTLKNLKKETIDNDEILDIVNKIAEDDRTIEDLKKDYPNEIKNLEEALHNYIGENDLKVLKPDFSDKWNFLTKKLAYPCEYFNGTDDYQKPVDNSKKGDLFNKLNKKCPDDEEIERTKENIERLDIRNGDELTEIYLKSDVVLLTCLFEKFIKTSVHEFAINPLFCKFTWLYLAMWFETYRN